MKRAAIYILILLSFTNIELFKMGLASFTPFHALMVGVIILFYGKELTYKKLKFPKYFTLVFSYIVAVNLINLYVVKLTSVVYSLVILVEMLFLFDIVQRMSNRLMVKILKYIILLYFLNISLTFFFITIGEAPQGVLNLIFQYYDFAGSIRPQGFSSEPSYAAIIVVFTMFALLKAYDFQLKKDVVIWSVLSIVSVLLTQSSYGILLVMIILGYTSFINRKTLFKSGFSVLLITSIAVLTIIYLMNSEFKSLSRLIAISDYIVDSDDVLTAITNIAYVDGSASLRIVPSIQLIGYYGKAGWFDILFGMGAGQATIFFSNYYYQISDIEVVSLGFIPAFIYNYGVIGSALVFFMLYDLLPKERWLISTLLFLFLFNADFNTQIFLFVVTVTIISKRIQINKENLKTNAEN